MKLITSCCVIVLMALSTLWFFDASRGSHRTQRPANETAAAANGTARNTLVAQRSAPALERPTGGVPRPIRAAPTALLADAASLPSLYQFSGPYVHANLAVFLVHGQDTTKMTFLTLQEALQQKKAVVHETDQVNELSIENISLDEDVFVQSGDIVKGGKQDRVIAHDFIVPHQSGKMPIGSFCVEQGRWSQRGNESQANFNSSTEQAPGKSLKLAAKQRAAQGEVWQEVAQNQNKLAQNLKQEVKSALSRSSYALTVESRAVQESAEDYIRALSTVIDGKRDCVGFVFAINGEVNNADIYATHDLFVKLWPKLLKAAAVEALAEFRKDLKVKPVAKADVEKLVNEPEKAAPTAKELSKRVRVLTKETSDSILFETSDEEEGGMRVHKSYLKK